MEDHWGTGMQVAFLCSFPAGKHPSYNIIQYMSYKIAWGCNCFAGVVSLGFRFVLASGGVIIPITTCALVGGESKKCTSPLGNGSSRALFQWLRCLNTIPNRQQHQ